jgi:hypothetical protein
MNPAPSSCRYLSLEKIRCNLLSLKRVTRLRVPSSFISHLYWVGRLWGGAINTSDAPVCDEARGCVFVVGQPLPDTSSIVALSNAVNVDVEWRAIRLPAEARHDSVCLDWEPWVRASFC